MEEFDINNIKAIIGLGNPGIRYYKNRHNIGFRIIDKIAKIFSEHFKKSDFMESCFINYQGQKIYLIKPQTFMNSSGKVVPFLLKKGIKSEDVLIIHDELEKKLGNLGFKFAGSAKGHNGLRSIIQVLGKDFWRFWFGIGRPKEKSDVANYVLSNFSEEEELEIEGLIKKSVDMILKK